MSQVSVSRRLSSFNMHPSGSDHGGSDVKVAKFGDLAKVEEMESKLEEKSARSATSESVTDGSEHDLEVDQIKIGKLSRL